MADISIPGTKVASTSDLTCGFPSRLVTGAMFATVGAFLLFLLQFVSG